MCRRAKFSYRGKTASRADEDEDDDEVRRWTDAVTDVLFATIFVGRHAREMAAPRP